MPNYDRICCSNPSHILVDSLEPLSPPQVLCPYCGEQTSRGFTGTVRSAAVISDGIPGGVEMKHGLCNEDGSPRRYYSKSDINREAKARGLVNYVVHQPPKGTDKSPHTSRWV